MRFPVSVFARTFRAYTLFCPIRVRSDTAGSTVDNCGLWTHNCSLSNRKCWKQSSLLRLFSFITIIVIHGFVLKDDRNDLMLSLVGHSCIGTGLAEYVCGEPIQWVSNLHIGEGALALQILLRKMIHWLQRDVTSVTVAKNPNVVSGRCMLHMWYIQHWHSVFLLLWNYSMYSKMLFLS